MITAIVLAAGESRRTGAVNKLLLPFGGTTLIEHVVGTVVRSEAGAVTVVVGHEAERVRAALAAHPVAFVDNSRYREGMTTSIQAGVRAASPEAQGLMICLSDLPRIETAELNWVMAVFEQAAEAGRRPIVVPTFAGRRGNPVIFSAHYRAALLEHTDMTGCKAVVQRHADAVVEAPMAADHVLHDVDTMDAYQRLLEGS